MPFPMNDYSSELMKSRLGNDNCCLQVNGWCSAHMGWILEMKSGNLEAY